MSVYEVHLGSWRQGLGYREIADQLVDYLAETGFTHVELLPVAEHPFGGSWGYQVTSYYAPTARFGTPDDFRYFVDTLHQAGYGVIVDWVPAHFPKDEWALARFDGTPLYEHADPRRGEQPDWGTYVFDFGRPEVRNFLVANALFWLEEFHVDGLRVDAVASMLYLDYSRPEGQWLPNIYGGRENLDAVAFLQEMNATVYRHHPGVDDDRGGVDRVARRHPAHPPRRPRLRVQVEHGLDARHAQLHRQGPDLPRLPPQPDDVLARCTPSARTTSCRSATTRSCTARARCGSGCPATPGTRPPNLRALLAFMWAHPGKQLLFMGGEFGQAREWSEDRSLDWDLSANPLHGGIKNLVADLNRVYKDYSALWTRDNTPEGFSWIDANDAERERAELPAPRRRRGRQPDRAGLHRELLRRSARGLPRRAAVHRPLARGAQHRRRALRRVRRGQPRRRRGRAADVARPAGVRGAAAATLRACCGWPPSGPSWTRSGAEAGGRHRAGGTGGPVRSGGGRRHDAGDAGTGAPVSPRPAPWTRAGHGRRRPPGRATDVAGNGATELQWDGTRGDGAGVAVATRTPLRPRTPWSIRQVAPWTSAPLGRVGEARATRRIGRAPAVPGDRRGRRARARARKRPPVGNA